MFDSTSVKLCNETKSTFNDVKFCFILEPRKNLKMKTTLMSFSKA